MVEKSCRYRYRYGFSLGNNVEHHGRRSRAAKWYCSLTAFDVSAYSTRFGGSIKDFDIADYMPAKDGRKMDPFIQYGMAPVLKRSRIQGLR